MPYNTRRKSLSLPSLGIHVPVTHAARAAAAAANRASASPNGNTSTRSHSPASMASPASLSRDTPPPSKKLKRAHSDDPDDNMRTSQPLAKRREDAKVKFENTPPPSPRERQQSIEMDDDVDSTATKPIDMEGINDEIVEAVIVQLQSTANRPHLVKELAAVLMHQLKIVQQSANPCAIISSRLASYLKRSSWSAKAPCPLAKELESVHPRRTYFYLTTCPHLPLPDPAHAAVLSNLAHSRTIISPSLSSVTSNSEDADMDRRRELSPSPEVDLSSPEFDDMDDEIAMPTTPIGSLSLRGFGMGSSQMNRTHGHNGRQGRNVSPPLEKDEKEFTQTADGLQKRKLSGDLLSATTSPEHAANADLDYCQKDDNGLFGEKMLVPGLPPISFMTSPAIRPSTMSLNLTKRDGEAESWMKLDHMLEWDRSPENIELDELDGLLNDY
ncbi:hypothetical protein B0H66DRAFT_292097 [Apodospora peruviana]|uniref:GDS1 winged helix domain-containing protein n=1 Tax=Apodospora peruviana TaxID=516989 RepID=A0AAE0I2C4_9PEZI|nr:hypothetical protein B0H66DRAFT_292097 [Apodospora peruviana]